MSEGVLFPDCWKVLLVVPVFKNVAKRSTGKNYCSVSLLCAVIKSLTNLQIRGLLTTWQKVAYFLISCKVLGLLGQMQIF